MCVCVSMCVLDGIIDWLWFAGWIALLIVDMCGCYVQNVHLCHANNIWVYYNRKYVYMGIY